MAKRLTFTLALLLSMMAASAATTDGFTGGRNDFRDETIYFAITTRFYDGDETNNVMCWDNQAAQQQTKDPCWRGDFKGLIERLDYIKALGFTAIWITPVVQNASGYDYHGYHAMDFTKVDLRYESRKEWGATDDVRFSDLLEAVHARGMKLILDIVLNHTGNFGEATLCPMFDRAPEIKNQASIQSSMLPRDVMGGAAYWQRQSGNQYQMRLAMMKNTDGQNHDSGNLYHHYGNFNWDDHTRWYAQIAGDCVDLNTENPATYRYLRECYGEFIKMGVDGFRIDTSGHIARVTYNQAFVPYFLQLGEEYKDRRPGGTPFYLFGEVCAKSGTVLYRNESVACSPFFYTWKGSDYGWTEDESEWNTPIMVTEDTKSFQQSNLKACEAEWAQYGGRSTSDFRSTNAFLNGNDYHEPDYSQASGFSVIDFPIHYNFSNAGKAISLAKEGDAWYNDATWNVVYVDSHDYGPQENGYLQRFNGGTAQWAENLSLMFTFRGIPCLYYGSEVEFQAGKVIDLVSNGTLSTTCSGKGNLRVWVLDGPGRVGDDGRYAYASQPVARGGKPQFTDSGASRWYSAADGDWVEPEPEPEPDAHDITIYVTSPITPYLYIWNDNKFQYNGGWPGKLMTATVTVGDTDYYCQTLTNVMRVNIIFNNGQGAQTADITGITADSWFSYDGQRTYQRLSDQSGVSLPTADRPVLRAVYALTGQRVATITDVTQLRLLLPGVYIVGQQKIVIR